MTERRPAGPPRPFGADELDGVSGLRPDVLAADTRLARELEAGAARVTVRPSADFADRVMAAIVLEPVAAPARAARTALRHGAIGAFLLSLRDAWRVSVSPAFPMAMRAQAIALVLVVGGLVAGTGAIAAGALGVFDGDPHAPTPSPALRTLAPTPSPTEEPSISEPSSSPEPPPSVDTESAEPSDSADPPEGTEPDEAERAVAPARAPAATRAPTRTPRPTASPRHETHGNEPTRTPRPSETPGPSATPPPTSAPSPTPKSD